MKFKDHLGWPSSENEAFVRITPIAQSLQSVLNVEGKGARSFQRPLPWLTVIVSRPRQSLKLNSEAKFWKLETRLRLGGQTFNPLANQLNPKLVDDGACDRRHTALAQRFHALP